MLEIYIFGAGEAGVHAIMELGKENIAGVVDNYKSGSICGIPIQKLSDLDVQDKDNVLFFITPQQYKREIASELKANGYNRFSVYTYVFGGGTKLEADEWGNIYNEHLLNKIIGDVKNMIYSSWSQEMLKITSAGDKVLEIGCGSGTTTLALATAGRVCTAIDYSAASVNLLKKAAEILKLSVRTYVCDARKNLPFKDNEFDFVFQAGLLEHFSREERVELLKLWRPVGKNMVSMIPNANSVPYRIGKSLQEKSGDWQYGQELPQSSMITEFIEAGYQDVREYTIGLDDALSFLPKEHYMRVAFEKWFSENNNDLFGQGYLLVTLGKA